ncbi:MAG: type VI secretion system tip protein VgrG [Candidatus Contendobacter sp.]|nr:MAG: type VI secretion system tip protein VgrG [Candidatus Contendobacter sp.]
MAATQKHRTIAVASALGADALLFRRMETRERLSQPFEFHLDLFSENPGIKFTDVLGQPMVVRLNLPKEERVRYFHGLVSEFRQIRGHGRYAVYQATMQPWLWFLSRTADCRIYQNVNVPHIVQSIFREHGFGDFQVRLTESYPPREYCVQYRETTLDFVNRLLEEEGIYYYFKHEQDKHVLVLADSIVAHEPFPGYGEVAYLPPEMHERRHVEHIHDWELTQRVQPGAYAHTDFDFQVPRKNLYRRLEMPRHHAQDHYEIYDYPGEYTESEPGQTYARVRLEELRAQYEIAEGRADARGLATGRLFSLAHFPRQDQNRQYLLTATTIRLDSDDYESRPEGQPAGLLCDCQFTALDAREPYRPPRMTPKAIVRGPQTATVVGPKGQEIWTDRHGRVKCQFHWDRYGESNENSSCWIRVSQPWAGKNWGGISIPRIGQEVIVDFLEGDPDRPLITGRVYNGANMPPYPLPAGAVISGMKTNTTGKITYQENKAPSQAAAVRESAGSYRYSLQVGDDADHSYRLICDVPPPYIGGQPTDRVDADSPSSTLVAGGGVAWEPVSPANANRFIKPLAGQSLEQIMEGVRGLVKPAAAQGGGPGYNEICMDDTAGNELMRMHAQYDKDSTVNNDERSQVGNDLTRSVANNETVSIGNDETLAVGNNSSESIGNDKIVTVGNNSSESIGQNKVITAGTSITLKCGASLIHMNQAGVITISGSLITVAGSVNINVAAPVTTVTGAALMTTTGAINLVNGTITRVTGSALGHFEGGKAELVSTSETLVMGPVVKINS